MKIKHSHIIINRREEDRKFTLEETKDISGLYGEYFIKDVCEDAIIINNDEYLESAVKKIKRYMDPFLVKL